MILNKTTIRLIIILVGFLLFSCSRPQNKISNYIIPLNIDSNTDLDTKTFEKIGDIVEDKEIVILGESEHGDGKTHEMKSRLIKYLVEEKGFNTIALEGTSFSDLEILNTNTALDSLITKRFKNNWLRWWGQSVQKQALIRTIKKNKINLVGVGSFSYLLSHAHNHFWQKYFGPYLVDLHRKEADKIIKRLQKINQKTYILDTAKVSLTDIAFYKKHLKDIKENIPNNNGIFDTKEKAVFNRMVENMISYADQVKYRKIIGTDEAISKWVNIRDKQMAQNLISYKKRNRNAKIIVWIANFHGAKKISAVRYKEYKNKMYDGYTLFGEHLYNAFKKKVYSIAFTSSRGETARIFEEKATVIDAPKGTLEQQLENKGIEYGFIDFSGIRQTNPSLKDKIFKSTILGHDPKPGKWLRVFDGVFFIQKNERAVKYDRSSINMDLKRR